MIHFDVREPTDDQVGAISARAGDAYGLEICFAVGPKFGDWYVSLNNEMLWAAAGIEPQRTCVAGGRSDAENLVRLLAALCERAVSA